MKKFRSIVELRAWLHAAGIDISSWGEGNAKTIEHLWDELRAGEAIIQDQPPLRLVDVVQLLVRRDGQFLLEVEQELENGQRRFRNQPPSEKIKPGEHYLEAARRCFQEELGISPSDVIFSAETYERVQVESDSLSYPGLTTRYTFHRVEAQVTGLPDADFWRENRAYGAGDPVRRHLWQWQHGS